MIKTMIALVVLLSVVGCVPRRTAEDREKAEAYCKLHGNGTLISLHESVMDPIGSISNFGCMHPDDSPGFTMIPDYVYSNKK